jgi:predicted site-specific integrase-resolvase
MHSDIGRPFDHFAIFGPARVFLHCRSLVADVFHFVERWASASGGRAMQGVESANSAQWKPKRLLRAPQGMETNKAAKAMPRKELPKSVAYFRTSSATNVGPDKDSLKRQRAAVVTFAKSAGYEIVEEFYDAAVSGADAVDERPGFAAMLQRLLGNGVRTIIVETASRFARDLIVQETGWRFLRNAGVTLVAADSPDSFLELSAFGFTRILRS